MLPLATYRRWAVELAEYACGYTAGRPESDAVYQAVTEGRDRGAMQRRYSSCGDLAMWLFYRLGVRSQWVNRAEHGGHLATARHNNVTLLQQSAALLRKPHTGTRYQPGDVGIIWATGYDAHVFVILDDQQPHALYVAEYGQPGGHLKARVVGYHTGLLCIGVKSLEVVLPLEAVLRAAAVAGELGQPENVRSYAARLHLPPPNPGASDTEPPDNTEADTLPPAPDTVPDNPPQTLKRRDGGRPVERLQVLLNAHGTQPLLRIDGDFGPRTEGALRAFQRAHGLVSDGICGPYTWQELQR